MNAQPDSEYDVFCFLFFCFQEKALSQEFLELKKKKSEKEDSV